MTRTATLASPALLPTTNGYAVVADDASGPFPRVGDVMRESNGWTAWPMGLPVGQAPRFRTRREAVAFVTNAAAERSR